MKSVITFIAFVSVLSVGNIANAATISLNHVPFSETGVSVGLLPSHNAIQIICPSDQFINDQSDQFINDLVGGVKAAEFEIGRIRQNYKLMNNLSIWPSVFWGPNLTMSKFLDSLVVSSRLKPVNSGWVIEVGVKADLIREYGTQDLTDRVFIELNEEFYSRPSQAGLVRLEKFARVVPRGCTIEVMNIDVVRN
jgi:hypothetical protein